VISEKPLSMAESFLERSRKKLWEAEDYSKEANYAESVSASQEYIELSVKAIFLLMQERYPKRHWFKDEELKRSRRSWTPYGSAEPSCTPSSGLITTAWPSTTTRSWG